MPSRKLGQLTFQNAAGQTATFTGRGPQVRNGQSPVGNGARDFQLTAMDAVLRGPS